MATLWNQMFKPDAGKNRLPVHAAYALLIRAISGKLNEATMKPLLDGTKESEEDIKGIFAKLETLTSTDRFLWAIKWHANALLADLSSKYEVKQAAIKDDTQFKEELGFTSVKAKAL
jgi:hypothetical protein